MSVQKNTTLKEKNKIIDHEMDSGIHEKWLSESVSMSCLI